MSNKQIGIGTDETFYRGNKSLPTGDVKFEWTTEMVAEIAKCSKNITHFGENYFWAITTGGKKNIELYKPQKRLLRALVDNRFVITLASRQSGKSTVMTIFALWYTCFQEDKRVLIVANREDTAKELLRRVKFAYEMLPNWLKPGVESWGQTEVFFSNGSSIVISATSSTAARGMTINVLVIDEMAFIPDHIMDEFWNSVIPVVSSDTTRSTKIFAVSTPNGTSNLFYKLYSDAEKGRLKTWKNIRIDWWEIPGRGKKWKEEIEEALAKQNKSFDQEFGNKFVETGETATDTEVIDALRHMSKKPKYTYEDGAYKIWESPDTSHIYTIGVDVAEGVGGCASVAMVFDITDLTNIRQTAVYHSDTVDPYHFAAFIYKMSNQWGAPPLLIERNGPGGQVIDALKEVHKYPLLVEYGPDTGRSSNRLGIFSHTNTKSKAITNMRYWINSLRVVNIYDISTVQEMETFVRYPNGTWKKRAGNFVYDDRIHAMLWALFVLDSDIVTRYYEVEQYDERGKPLKLKSYYESNEDNFQLRDVDNINQDGMPMFYFNGVSNDTSSYDVDMFELESSGWTKL